MSQTLQEMEKDRQRIYRKMMELGDFRPGTISVNYRKCGKKRCICCQPDHPGHGPQYLWNTTRKSKSLAQNLRLGPDLEKVRREVENYKTFQKLCREVTGTNEAICRLRPIPEIQDEGEREALKKKLRNHFYRRLKRKSAT